MKLIVDLEGLDLTGRGIEIAKALVKDNGLSLHELRVIGAFLLAYAQKHKFDE